jgi:hypothetical protein
MQKVGYVPVITASQGDFVTAHQGAFIGVYYSRVSFSRHGALL